jgi:hypothetical protein
MFCLLVSYSLTHSLYLILSPTPRPRRVRPAKGKGKASTANPSVFFSDYEGEDTVHLEPARKQHRGRPRGRPQKQQVLFHDDAELFSNPAMAHDAASRDFDKEVDRFRKTVSLFLRVDVVSLRAH